MDDLNDSLTIDIAFSNRCHPLCSWSNKDPDVRSCNVRNDFRRSRKYLPNARIPFQPFPEVQYNSPPRIRYQFRNATTSSRNLSPIHRDPSLELVGNRLPVLYHGLSERKKRAIRFWRDEDLVLRYFQAPRCVEDG